MKLISIINFSDLLASDKILPFFDLFHKEVYKIETSKMILQTFSRLQLEPTDNSVASSTLLYVARVCPMELIEIDNCEKTFNFQGRIACWSR